MLDIDCSLLSTTGRTQTKRKGLKFGCCHGRTRGAKRISGLKQMTIEKIHFRMTTSSANRYVGECPPLSSHFAVVEINSTKKHC